MNIQFIRADQLSFDPRYQMGLLFVEGFSQFFRMLLLSNEYIAKAFSHIFNLEKFYVAVDGRRVLTMAACTDGTAPVAIDKKICQRELGYLRGSFVYYMLTKFIVNHKFPFRFTPHMGRIGLVATATSTRGKGIAYQLLKHMMENTSYTEHVLDVLADNPAAIHLYKKLGFAVFHTVRTPLVVRLVIKDFLYMRRVKEA